MYMRSWFYHQDRSYLCVKTLRVSHCPQKIYCQAHNPMWLFKEQGSTVACPHSSTPHSTDHMLRLPHVGHTFWVQTVLTTIGNMQKGFQPLAIEGEKSTHSVHKEKAMLWQGCGLGLQEKEIQLPNQTQGSRRAWNCPSAGEPCRASTLLAS